MRTYGCLVVGLMLVSACASSRPEGTCDPTRETCADAGTQPDAGPLADAPPDGPPLAGFGEPCSDNAQCESQLCILVGTTGQCTKLCGECPEGYGCLGVEGISIDGEVTFVCVPTSNQLCTPCLADSECTLIGMDKCVTYPDGDRACARDCEDVTCPTGYACQTMNIGGAEYQQCMASSGACDCTATNPGAMQPCNIMTPWNVCIGAQTCGGASGWGGCEPPSPNDDPDAEYEDSNCDGIDGDRARAIFVAQGGVNSPTCGLVYSNPCQTISFGITRAVAESRPHVYVQSGNYGGALTMANGVSVYGGYDFNWRRNAYSTPGHTVTISGGATAVRFNAINQPTRLDNVIVRSANAGSTGASSIGVLVTGSQFIEVRGVLVEPGAGGPGLDGTDGTVGDNGSNGGPGSPGCEDSTFLCSSCARPAGGTSGGSSCGRNGGRGGQPGYYTAGGEAGANGVGGTSGGAGAPCAENRACDGTVGATGATGLAGAPGSAGAMMGSFNGFTYTAANGGIGVTGANGNGGGGGGGGGGGSNDCDSYGSSGGGGGGGGCGGTRGLGGSGGGGSFGVIALDSQLVISSSIVSGGNGGAGGDGGAGGAGGNGGAGGAGGAYGGGDEQDDGGDGAAGGAGGRGGRGGQGGGGGGGPSVAVVCLGASTSMVDVLGSTLAGGSGGAGGTSNGMAGLSSTSFNCPF